MTTPKEFENKLLYLEIQYTDTFKTFIEGLKEILNDTIFEIICGDKQETSTIEKSQEPVEQEYNDDSDSELVHSDIEDENFMVAPVINNEDDEIGISDIETTTNEKPKETSTKNTDYTGDCIKILTFDPNKTMLIKVLLYGDQFSKFYCKKKTLEIGINLVELQIHTKSVEKTESLCLYINDNDKHNLRINTVNELKNCEGTSKIKLLEIDKITLELPKIDFNTHIVFNTLDFHKLCKSMNQIGELVEIKCTRKAITFSCKGTSILSKTFYTGKEVKIEFAEVGATDIVQGIYELKSFMLFTKFQTNSTEIEIFMTNNYPICVQYTIAALGIIIYCLNPSKSEPDEENDDEEEYSDSDDDSIKYKIK